MIDKKAVYIYFTALCTIFLIKALFMASLIIYGDVGLGPDEAQYWTWSQKLDWGYYSKPPGIAWQIWLGVKLFGDTEFGVRFVSILFAFPLSLAVYFLALACKLKPNTAFWAGVVMAFSPLGMLASFFAITDVGMALFWTLACLILANALSRQEVPRYYSLGFVILCGALFKWPIYLFWVFPLSLTLFYPWLISRHLFGGFVLSLCGLLPSVIWNWTHHWVTFRHVFSTIAGEHGKEQGTLTLFHGNFFEFLAAQAALLSPIIFILLILAFIALFKYRRRISPALIFCGICCLGLLTLYSVMAFFQKMQGNWCSFAYSPGIVLLCWHACEADFKKKIWLKAGVISSIILCLAAFSMPYIQMHGVWSNYPIPYKINPFRHNLGWQNLSNALLKHGYRADEHFLFGDKYQMSSILSFYGPHQKRAYFFNIHGIRHNQFSFWPSMAQEQKGKTGFFILAENTPHLQRNQDDQVKFYKQTLTRYFAEVHFLGVSPLFSCYGNMVKGAFLFKCVDYNGREPANPELY